MSKPRRQREEVNGVLLLDKPLGLSSNTALQKARWLYNAAKAGHTGVLDPLATGLLPVCLGEATKFSSFLLDADKSYRATARFGVTTTTGDAEGEVVRERPVAFGQADLLAAFERFTGEIEQIPPMYSALKHQGKALYEYARAGVEIERAARTVTIHSITLVALQEESAVFDVVCSKGTYIRTLAEDIGEHLHCGAHLTALRRTGTAGFSLDDAVTLEALEALDRTERHARLLPVDVLVGHLPACSLDEVAAGRFLHGQAVHVTENHAIMSRFRVYRSGGRGFLGLGEQRADGMLHPVRLLAAYAAG